MKEHPLKKEIQKVDEEIKKLKEKKDALEGILRDKEAEARKKLKADYEYSAVAGRSDDLPSYYHVPKGLETLKILRHLVNGDAFEKHLHYYGVLSDPPVRNNGTFVAKETSPYYFRIDDHLYHVGGGHLILKDFIKVSDEEWECLKKGKIPRRLIRNAS